MSFRRVTSTRKTPLLSRWWLLRRGSRQTSVPVTMTLQELSWVIIVSRSGATTPKWVREKVNFRQNGNWQFLGFTNNPNGDEYDKDIVGNTFKIGGRKFSTKHAYYLKLDARDLKSAKETMLKRFQSGWVDEYTRYMAIVVNFYDPIFKIMMYYAIIYDKRFNFNSLVNSILPSVKKLTFLDHYQEQKLSNHLRSLWTVRTLAHPLHDNRQYSFDPPGVGWEYRPGQRQVRQGGTVW